MKREFKRVQDSNPNQNDSLFFFQGDVPATLNVVLVNEERYEFLARVEGEKKIYKGKDRVDLDLSTMYSNDEELNNDIQNDILEIENNNWFGIFIIHNNEEYSTEDIIYSLEELNDYTDQDLLDLIKENVI